MKEAIEVGKMVRRGAASKIDKFAATLIQPGAPAASSSNEGRRCQS
jgi:hypothetical protein